MSVNMSYCRFQNTLDALIECTNALADGGTDPLSALDVNERKAARRLLKLCGELAADYGDDAGPQSDVAAAFGGLVQTAQG